MTTKKETQKSDKTSKGFSAEEKAAAKARIQELKAEERANKSKAEGEKVALAAINTMQEPDRSMAKKIHAIIKENAPSLSAKTWYGMPAYADEEGKVVCFFQTAKKFNTRYSTFGFNDAASLDDDNMWPVAFALTKLTSAEEHKIAALVKKAAGQV